MLVARPLLQWASTVSAVFFLVTASGVWIWLAGGTNAQRPLRLRRCPHPSLPSSRAPYCETAEFGDVFLPAFSQQPRNVSFAASTASAGFDVFALSGGAPMTDPRRYSLIASLQGPEDRHFSCYLLPQPGGSLSCPKEHLRALAPGNWNVSVMLFRTQRHNASCGAGLGASAPPRAMKLLDFILERGFSTFPEFLECFDYPRTTALKFGWNKTAAAAAGGGARCLLESAGEWVAYPGGCSPPGGGGKPPLCKGTLDPALVESKVNEKRGIHHVFRPFSCHFRLFSKRAAAACLARTRPVLVGDSRDRILVEAARRWLGDGAGSGTLDFHWWTQNHFGLQKPMHSEAAQALALASLLTWAADNRTVVVDSLLHDMADYEGATLAADVVATFPASDCVPRCAAREGATVAQCNCTAKHGAVQLYTQNVRRVARLMADAKARVPTAALFWLTNHRRAPLPGERLYSWQTNDVLHAAEAAAAAVMAEAGLPHIDFSHHVTTSPARWWSDAIHYGSAGRWLDARFSLFKHQSLQILLNRIC